MFVHMKKLPAKTADFLDLAIEFATLGEYGLECPDGTATPCPPTAAPDCGSGDLRPCIGGRTADRRREHHVASPALPEALRPPRIKLSFS